MMWREEKYSLTNQIEYKDTKYKNFKNFKELQLRKKNTIKVDKEKEI